MPAVIQYIRQAGAEASVDVFNIAGHVTMDAISLSIFADAPGSASKLGQGVRPRYAELMDPGTAPPPPSSPQIKDTSRLAMPEQAAFLLAFLEVSPLFHQQRGCCAPHLVLGPLSSGKHALPQCSTTRLAHGCFAYGVQAKCIQMLLCVSHTPGEGGDSCVL